jgi:hypothetical protein
LLHTIPSSETKKFNDDLLVCALCASYNNKNNNKKKEDDLLENMDKDDFVPKVKK